MKNKINDLKTFLTPWERVLICRNSDRPRTLDYLNNITDSYEEIFGDKLYGDDPSIITAFGKIKNEKFIFIGLEKGNDTESRLKRNFGMAHPEGYRKALKAMKLAEKFNIPVVSFLDTPGAFPGLAAEERGQAIAIAKNLFEMSYLKTPIIVVLIGEGCSGGALGIGIGDIIGMLEHSYYSVISPEGCASILWKNPTKNKIAAGALKMHAEELLKLKVIDQIIKEPKEGAHTDTKFIYGVVKDFIINSYNKLKSIHLDELVEKRYNKLRSIGNFQEN